MLTQQLRRGVVRAGLRAFLRVEELDVRCMPAAIRLDLVALHEFGHSLGLAHSSNPASIMYAYYNANYDVANFANDPSVATFQSLYADPDSSPWKDNLDGANDGVVDITYSFMPDGVRMDSGKRNTLNSTMDRIFGAGNWESIFATELNRWASVSNGKVAFVEHGDGPYDFNTSGLAQNDSRFGDIRIGTHRFDGPSKVLAHTYYPPPNGATAAGDAHFDQAEDWVLAGDGLSGGGGHGGGGGGGGGNLTMGDGLPAIALPVVLAPQTYVSVPVQDNGAVSSTRDSDNTTMPTVDEKSVTRNEAASLSSTLPILSASPEVAVDYFAVLAGMESN
jgi:hypothetical protein